jgi:predicted MFS family arabinose efflux permease
VPDSRDPAARPLDRGSALRWWAALTAALIAIIEGPQQGWASPVVIGAGVAAVVLLVAFVHRERVSDRPMIPAATARDPRLRWGAVTMSALFFSAFGVQFVLTQWLQGPRHKSAMGAAVYFLPNAIAGIVASLRNPRWVARFGQGAVAAGGLGAMAGGAALTAVGVAASSEVTVLVAAALVGLGIGTSAASGAELIMSSASADNAGAAAGVNETIVEAAGALGIAVLGTVFAATHSYAWPMPVGAAIALVAAIGVAGGLSPRGRPRRPSTRRSRSGHAP